MSIEMAHTEINIGFTINGLRFLASGFLPEGDMNWDWAQIVASLKNLLPVMHDDDFKTLSENTSELPKELNAYHLLVHRKDFIYCITDLFEGRRGGPSEFPQTTFFNKNYLVVRRPC